ncbi:hypothetical protein CPC08DRAFT_725020 [Agrocybe pediades]|nr:hypothetical protein CPC08DRAFT_725020 [Agrocybe pediades]
MKSFFTAIIASAVFAGSALAAATISPLVVNTPASPVTRGQTVSISWNGGVAPYLVTVNNVSNPARPVIEDLGPGTESGNSGTVNWVVDAAAGINVVFQVADSQGALASSNAVAVQA